MIYPNLTLPKLSENTITAFGGLNKTSKCPENCFFDTQNTSAAFYPYLSVREKRAHLKSIPSAITSLHTENGITYTLNSALFYNGILQFNGLENTDNKQIISMGSYNIVFPDGYYINTRGPEEEGVCTDQGFLSNKKSYKNIMVPITPCTADFLYPTCSQYAPENPIDQSLWLDTSVKPNKLYSYSSQTEKWANIVPTHLRIDANYIHGGFYEGDTVQISGLGHGIDGVTVIEKTDKNCIVVSASISNFILAEVGEVPFIVERSVPTLDFVCEHQNRLFGCRYGQNKDGEFVNEIYASKLGDPKNWNAYHGLSTDSYSASCGSEGGFTGIISYLGSVLFFKENRIHRLMGTKPSNFTIYEDNYPGVKKNSEKSLCLYNGSLFYHSNDGICRYSGSAPVIVSKAFGNDRFSYATAAICKDTYYVCMTHTSNNRSLYSFDIQKEIWHKEDDCNYTYLSRLEDNILGVRKENNQYYFDLLFSSNIPKICNTTFSNNPQIENDISWYAESGWFGLSVPDFKYLNKLKLRFESEKNSSLSVYILVGNSTEWEECATFVSPESSTYTIYLNPPRSDRFKIKIAGIGKSSICSLTKVLEKASEVN